MKTSWERVLSGDRVWQVAESVRVAHHPDIEEWMVRWVLRDPPAVRKGREAMGTARVISARERAVYEIDELFIIELSRDAVERLTPAQLRALIDHEICHCSAEYDEEAEEWKARILPHDVEDFHAVLARHGAWTVDVQRAREQLDLFRDRSPAEELMAELANLRDQGVAVSVDFAGEERRKG